MRLLIINFEYPPLGGGGGIATEQFARELSRRHEVHVLTTGMRGLKVSVVQHGVHIFRVPVLGRKSLPTATLRSLVTFVPAALWQGWRLCRLHRYDVINAQFVVPSGLPAVLLAQLFHIPFVLSFIGGDIFDPTKGVSPHRYSIFRWIIRTIARYAVVCTAISNDTKRRAELLHGVDRPIVVTHLGIRPSAVRTLSRRELGLPEGAPIFISIGRLIPRKGYAVLFDAWRQLPNVHLLVVGDGPLRKTLADEATKYALGDRVHFLGFVDELRKQQLLRAATGYVSAAEHEGFGLVFLEAMEAGLPIVAANDGGHLDFLKPEVNALLVEPRQPRAIVEAVQRLLADAVLRERMVKANREAVRNFYLDIVVRKFERVLIAAHHARDTSNKAEAFTA